MLSPKGFAAAVVLLATVPVAITVEIVFGGGAEPIIHFGIGAGALLLALSMFDFPVPRWITWIGAAAAALFGATFVLQGIADSIDNESLYHFAFQVLGQQFERVLPDIILAWFVALLIVGSGGRSRILGWILIPIVVVAEAIVYVGPLVGIEPPFVKVSLLLPFVWLLVESAKVSHAQPNEAVARRHVVADSAAVTE